MLWEVPKAGRGAIRNWKWRVSGGKDTGNGDFGNDRVGKGLKKETLLGLESPAGGRERGRGREKSFLRRLVSFKHNQIDYY
jgi:hypothetical protein